jgi:hypothetical protein
MYSGGLETEIYSGGLGIVSDTHLIHGTRARFMPASDRDMFRELLISATDSRFKIARFEETERAREPNARDLRRCCVSSR